MTKPLPLPGLLGAGPPPRVGMSEHQIRLALALGRCKFSAGSFDKRFCRQKAEHARTRPGEPLTESGAAMLEKMGHRYRRQLGGCMAENCAECAKGMR